MKKDDFEDDGRTIADMSGIEWPSLFSFGRAAREKRKEKTAEAGAPAQEEGLTKSQNRAYMLGAIVAGLAITAVFIICGAIAIFIMTQIWK